MRSSSRCRFGARSRFRSTGSRACGGLGLGLAFLFLVVPPVFGRLAGLVSLPIPGVGPEVMPRFTSRLLAQGLLWSSCGWILLGLSQLAVVRSFDPPGMRRLDRCRPGTRRDRQRGAGDRGRLRGGRAPRGTGSARGVLMSALAPAIGSDQAVIASLLLRLVWVAAELVAAAILFPLFRRPPSDGGTSSANGPRLPMISVVVPVHDEEESLTALHGELDAVFADGARGPVEFIFVDDGSRDGSWAVLAALAGRDQRVQAIRFRRNFGKAAALTAGFLAARGDLVFTLDGDLQDDPAEIPRFLTSLKRDTMWSAAGKRRAMIPGTRSIPAVSSTGWSAA